MNLTSFACLTIKKEVENPSKINVQEKSDGNNDLLLAIDVNKSVHLDQTDASATTSTSSVKSSTPKKRTRRRYVYSKPKKKKKKKDICENVVDTVNILNVEKIRKSMDNHSDCSSDTIILDDLSEEMSKDGANIVNEFSNNLAEEAKLQLPELGRLLISDGMLIAETKQKKGAAGKGRTRNVSSKGKKSKKMQSELMNELGDAPLLSIKKEFEDTPDPKTKPPVLFPIEKEPINDFPQKDATISGDFLETANLISASIDSTAHANKRRKPQTARRGKKRQISCERIIMQPSGDDILTMNNTPIKSGNNLLIEQSLISSKLNLPTSNFFESSVSEMSKAKVTSAKKIISTSLVSDILGNDRNVTNFHVPTSSNVLEQNNSSPLPTDLALPATKQNPNKKWSSPNKRNTAKGKLNSLDAGITTNSCDFPTAIKTKGRSPRKAPSKKALSSEQKGLDIVEKQSSIESSLVISVKKELNETLVCDNSVLKHQEYNKSKEFVSTSKTLPVHSVSNPVLSTKDGGSKTYVSLSFEEDTSKKDEPDEHLSFLLSLRSKKYKSKNFKDAECLKNPSKAIQDSPENTDQNVSDKSGPNLKSLPQSNASHGIHVNISNIKREAEHFPKNSVEMHSTNKVGVKSTKKTDGVECSKTQAFNSNIVTQSTFQSRSPNARNSDVSVTLEKNVSSDVIKEPVGFQKNKSAILHSILSDVEKLPKTDNVKRAMKSLNELANTCSSNISESSILNSDIAKLPLDGKNSQKPNVDIPQPETSLLELGLKPSENIISQTNKDLFNSLTFNSESVQNKNCESSSVSLSHIQIKQEPEKALPNVVSGKKNSSNIEAQILHEQRSESTDDTVEEVHLTDKRDTLFSDSNIGKRQNREQCHLNNQSDNETPSVDTSVVSTCVPNTVSKSQDSLTNKPKKTNKLPCDDSLSIQIKKEQYEVTKNAVVVDKEPSTVSPVLVELREKDLPRLTESFPTSDSITTSTISSLKNNICNVDNAVRSTSQTSIPNSSPSCVTVPMVPIKREVCGNTENSPIILEKSNSSVITNDISASGSKEKSLLDPQLEITSDSQVTKSSNVSSLNSTQSYTVSDLAMDDVEKSFTVPSSATKKTSENSSLRKSNSLDLKSKPSSDLDDLILISDESSSDSNSTSSFSDSDNESIHSLGDFEGPPRKKTRVNLSTGEVISETDNSLSATQDVSKSSGDSSKNLSDVNMSESANQSSFNEFMERIGDHVTRVRALEKENLASEPEVADELSTLLNEVAHSVHAEYSNDTEISEVESTSRPVTPFHKIMNNYLDSIMTCSSNHISDSNNWEQLDFLINYKKNELKFRKHPYPGDVPIRKRKPLTENYFRYDKEILDITIQNIEIKLKEIENIELMAPEDPGDAIRLDVYSLVPEEVECYYQLLTTDPSITLFSKYHPESTISSKDSNPVDDVICLSGSPSLDDKVSTKISSNENIDKDAIGSFKNVESFALTPAGKETYLSNDVIVINELSNSSLSQSVTKNICVPSSQDINAVEILEINSKIQTDSYENIAKEITVLSADSELANLSVSSIEMSDSLTRNDDNRLSNTKSNSCFDIQKTPRVPSEKILSDMTLSNKHALSSMDKASDCISLTSGVESSVIIADSHSGSLNEKLSKEILIDSNNSILLKQGSSLNSIPERPFSDLNKPSSDVNILTDSSSNYPKLLPIPETLENAVSESVPVPQIEEQPCNLLSMKSIESFCSEKDENSLVSSISNAITNPIFSNLDLPTSELRKILENVNTLPPTECNKPPDNSLNLKEPYQYDHASYPQHVVEYGHGIPGNDELFNASRFDKDYSYYDRQPLIKIPIVHDYGHKPIKDLGQGDLDASNKEIISAEVRHEVSSDAAACSKSDLVPDSDEDSFDNDSELPVESPYDESEGKLDTSKQPAAQDQEVATEKPQYKSRFQRVMERVSTKKSSKAQSSENSLTDCFPLRSSKDKSCIKKPIALVQPCSQKLTNKPPKGKKLLPLNDNPSSIKNSVKSKKATKSKKTKPVVKSKKNLKSPLKNKSLDDTSSLFQPDKIVKKVETKKKSPTSKSNPVKSSESPGNRLYGRVTNRGSFLTQSTINQPPKPKIHVNKKSMNKNKVSKVPTDELHLMVHSPNIDIIPTSKQLPASSNELFKSNRKIERSSLFFETTIGKTIPRKTDFNSNISFFRPQPKDPRTILKNLSPVPSSPNEPSNFFISPEPLISPNLSSILPNVQARKSSLPRKSTLLPNPDVRQESPQTVRRTLLPTPEMGFKNRVTDEEAWFTSSTQAQNYLDSFRNVPIRDFESETSLATNSSPSVSGSPISFNSEPPLLTEQSSPLISSHVHVSNRATHHRHSRTRQTRCVCLPPKSLKASVGNAIFDTASVLLLILEWNVDWLVQQQKNHDPPPISTCIKKVVNTYENNDEYYNTYLPLMLLETWQRIYMSWTHLHQSTSPYFCEVTSYSVETHSIKVQCQAVFKSSDAERGLYPEEGNIIMVKFGTKAKGGIKILGYIRDVKVRPFDASIDSASASYKCLRYTAGDSLQMLLLTFSGAYSSDDFDTNQLIRIQILCNINSTLRQNDALLNLKSSPLYRNILNPLTDGLRMVTVVTRNADPLKMKNNVSECVRDIIKGITSPHPLPLLTIAKSLPSSDRLLVLPPLIEMMRNSYKTKVLLCTRTAKALTDIGFNLCGGTIKFVILGKKSDIHQKLRKYLLEEVANKKLSKELSEDVKNDLLVSTKLDILKNCDVVLSLIRNCQNDLVSQAYADGESIAQMCCIIDEANLCTEPEILIPLLYGISKLILIGDPDVPAKVCSKTAANFDYNRSLFHRAYELDLASE